MSQAPHRDYAPPGDRPPQKSGARWAVLVPIALVTVLVLGILAALAISGLRRMATSGRGSEAKAMIGVIARAAVGAYERDGKLCDSAGPVPATVPSGRKHEPTPSDWNGFTCLRFSINLPFRYQYMYTRTGDSFVVTARGDVDGDGVFAEFSQGGTVRDGRVVLDAEITVKDESE